MSLSPTFPRPGELVAEQYLLTAVLGGNDQCIVYEARQRSTQRRVALRLSLMPADEAHADELLVPGRQLRHPGVLEVLDVLREPPGCVCSVLDWRAGESLEAYLSRTGPLPVAEVGRLLLPCIRGVIAERLSGVVRHAIGTSTLYVCAPTADEPEQTKLLPFELDAQRALQLLAAGPSALTAANGGPRMPEALAALLADPRTEVRAFGAIAHRALTGRPHTLAGEAQPTPGRNEVPPPVLPPIVRWFIERALSDDCERPFQTLEELATALESMTSAIPLSPAERSTALEPPTVSRRSTPPQARTARKVTPSELSQPAIPPLPTCLDATPARESTPSGSAVRGTAARAEREHTPSASLPRTKAGHQDDPARQPATDRDARMLGAAFSPAEPQRGPARPTLQLAGSPIDASPAPLAYSTASDAPAEPAALPPSATRDSLTPAARDSLPPSAARDSLTLSAARDSLTLSAARDSLPPSAARDSLTLSAARDSLTPSAARDSLTPSAARDSLTPSAARDSLPPSAARDSLPPSAARDSLTPSSARDSLPPSAARDSLPPSAARDSLPPSAARELAVSETAVALQPSLRNAPPLSGADERGPSLRSTLRLGTVSETPPATGTEGAPSAAAFRSTLPLDMTAPVPQPSVEPLPLAEAPANGGQPVATSPPAVPPNGSPARFPKTPHVERSRQLRAARATVTTVLPRTRVLHVVALGKRLLQARPLAYMAGALVLAAGLLTFVLDARRAPSVEDATTDLRAATHDERAESAHGAPAPTRGETPPSPPLAAEPQPEAPSPAHPPPRAATRNAPGPGAHARGAAHEAPVGVEERLDGHKDLPSRAPAPRVSPLTPPAKTAPAAASGDALDKMNLL